MSLLRKLGVALILIAILATTDLLSNSTMHPQTPAKEDIATLGGGCFWCLEAVYEQLEGVHEVTSGYMGGTLENPSYEAVCSGRSEHAEVVQIRYNPAIISYAQLLDWFWDIHNPTSLNRQGADVGTQYRSVIFYHNDTQKNTAQDALKAIQQQFDKPIVTELSQASTYYKAEAYHQNYYARNSSAGYCQFVIRPKLEKLDLE